MKCNFEKCEQCLLQPQLAPDALQKPKFKQQWQEKLLFNRKKPGAGPESWRGPSC